MSDFVWLFGYFKKIKDSEIGRFYFLILKLADFVLVIWLFKTLTDSEIGRFYAQIVKLADFMLKISNSQILFGYLVIPKI